MDKFHEFFLKPLFETVANENTRQKIIANRVIATKQICLKVKTVETAGAQT